MKVFASVDDLRCEYLKCVPRIFSDFAESGSWSESTVQENQQAFFELKFRQRVAIDTQARSTHARILGQDVTMPVALAPVGLAGVQWADGEIHAARAAQKFGVPFTLSTMSMCSIEVVAAATAQPFWFQLYMFRDRNFVAQLIERARSANCAALMLTLDAQVLAQRNKDVRNGLSLPIRTSWKNLIDLASHPRWCKAMLNTKNRSFGNIIGHAKDITDLKSFWSWSAKQFDQTLTWEDVAWVKRQWGGKLILKGIMDAEDARRALQCGADAIVVSNHGGRQLDGAPSTIAALPAIVNAVRPHMEVHLDGGVRSGQDVLRALALGANGIYIGRPYLYGLGAMQEGGVTRCLEIIAKELDVTMALCGLSDLHSVSPEILWQPQHHQFNFQSNA